MTWLLLIIISAAVMTAARWLRRPMLGIAVTAVLTVLTLWLLKGFPHSFWEWWKTLAVLSVVAVVVFTIMRRVALTVAALAIALIMGLIAWGWPPLWNWVVGDDNSSSKTTTTTTSISTDAKKAAVSDWKIQMPSRDGSRLNANGIDPANRGNAEAFRAQIANQAKHDPLTCAVYYNSSPYGQTEPIQHETDLAKDGQIKDGNVFSEKGKELCGKWLNLWNDRTLTDIQAVKEIKFQGANTGVNGVMLTSSNGVSGEDKSGVDVTYRDSTNRAKAEHSALNRCTQPTHQNPPPGTKPGPTDNPVPPPKTTTTTSKTTTSLTPKNPALDPAPRGEAPVGGGRNQDPGPGSYVPPSDMERPQAAPRQNPAPPVAPTPTTRPPSQPATTRVPPITSIPPIEVADPAPERPSQGCSPAPGRSC